jgi:hypothetical protein
MSVARAMSNVINPDLVLYASDEGFSVPFIKRLLSPRSNFKGLQAAG